MRRTWIERADAFFAANLGHEIAILATLVLTALAVYPVAVFLTRGWSAKKNEITRSFSAKAKQLYLNQFERIEASERQADAKFDRLYEQSFGRWRYTLPFVLFTVITAGALFFSCEWAIAHMLLIDSAGQASFARHSPGISAYIALPAVGAVAVLGAYLWIVNDLFGRMQRDMLPVDILNASLRLALSAPIGYAIGAIGGDRGGLELVIAFAAGAFPLSTVRTMLRQFATKKLDLGIGIDDATDDQVLKINSVDHPTADRLLDVGISTVSQLAYCDPVQLCMRTGLKFDYVVDIVSQALAWLYFGDKLDALRPAGLRGSIEMGNLLKAARGTPELPDTLRAAALCDIAADMVGLSVPAFLNALDETVGDSSSIFLAAVWRASGPGAMSTPAQPPPPGIPP